ncbi:hypothetical protein [Aliiruegeria sabulilitoris]|uniref:hypothetical protein n=1 Tax=Aliiruegeria sabulilitoris TaxID=1510458 RepID=UPI0009E6728C|nr:hypothetical protein [Aliiruegeria sabulilitoris]NDR55138.1 hypothetical protein [Pseudoruegeria sp. M32A2M]
MDRREFIAAGVTLAGAPLAAPSIARAQTSFNRKMTNAYGPGSPFYVEGPGSPTDFCKKVAAMSDGRITIQHFAAGELIPALEGFDAVRSGAVEMNAANANAWASLPADLQAIVQTAAMACNLESHTWCEANNASALKDMIENDGVIADVLPEDVVMELKSVTDSVLSEFATQDPAARKVHDAFMAFKAEHSEWAAISEKPYQSLPV